MTGHNDKVKNCAGFDRLLQRRSQPEFDIDNRVMRALEEGH
jgi:hypothetical protein